MKFKGHEAQLTWRARPDLVEEYKDAAHAAGGTFRDYAMKTHRFAQQYFPIQGALDQLDKEADAAGMSRAEYIALLLSRAR
jgi:hypothetical protein